MPEIKDITLADAGLARILWAERDMPVLASIRERFAAEQPLRSLVVGACMHVTTETANLMRALVAGGAEGIRDLDSGLAGADDDGAVVLGNHDLSLKPGT